MTEPSENRFYEGAGGRVPWMKRDIPRERERKPEKTSLKLQLFMAWSAISSVTKDIILRRDQDY